MNTTINLEKFTTSFGSEILDQLYKETPIVNATMDDFFKLPVNEGYKSSAEANINEMKTEEKEVEISLRFIEKDVNDNIEIVESKIDENK